MSNAKILLVDDEPNIRRSLEMILRSAGYASEEAASAHEAEQKLAGQHFDLMLLDIVMPELDGLEFLKRTRELPARPIVIMVSGNATIENAVAATREGAYDFIEKPITKDKLLLTIKNALAQKRLAEENVRLRREITSRFEMIGGSAGLAKIHEQINRVAPANTRVLILGESGTGKELVARAIHEASERAKQPFVKVNCAAIPEDLIESELFGHEKGAFTGATATREGKFQQAHHGTLFLDEVGDMSLKAQAKVLRVLQEGEFERVGGSQTFRVDVRVLAATNKNLEAEAQAGKFREDLLFRLNVVPIYLPPLRERKEDVITLIQHFTAHYCKENGFRLKTFAPEALARLREYSWPGNVRELRNTVERMVIMTPGDHIAASDLPLSLQTPVASKLGAFQPGVTLRDIRDRIEREYIQSCLAATAGNMSQAAELLGIERSNLYKKMKALGIAEK
ncbi:sigma-54-dependent Fis family transcriptional regulator [candidate division KSB1 bacterium]|nr:sigma-54-dependent Fis family transcriptional regulator [candidate division KSB1 bacterium]